MRLAKRLGKNKFILAALALGLVLLLLPSGGSAKRESGMGETPAFSLEAEEKRLCAALSKISGVGRVEAVLTLKATAAREVASDGGRDEVVTVQTGSGTQDAVTLRHLYPEYQGALIVCDGGASPSVKLAVTEAVASLTGLGTDRITVAKMGK